jgi:dienelactone hydrolase
MMLSDFVAKIRFFLTPSDAAWQGARIGLLLLFAGYVVHYLRSVIVPDFWIGKLTAALVVFLLSVLTGFLCFVVIRWLNHLPRNILATLLTVTPLLLVTTVITTNFLAGGLIYLLLVVTVCGLCGSLTVLFKSGLAQIRSARIITPLVISLSLLAMGGYRIFFYAPPLNVHLAHYRLPDKTLDLPRPDAVGEYTVKQATYGSGLDRHRSEFANLTQWKTEPVNARLLLPNWQGAAGWLRSHYWGFDATALPLQAHVWYPQQDGRFPLVLILHGNHRMEDPSDTGYQYIGRFLASHGFIVASVDQNFLNSSFADLSYLFDPGLDEENDARAWLLLQHLAQWRKWQGQNNHPLGSKIDMDNTVLIGHSRGGEAVAIAALFNQLSHYPDNARLKFDFGFDLGGVIAIAPTDGQYAPRKQPLSLLNTNFLTLQGSTDGDMQSFKGSSIYQRAKFSTKDYRFKSSLYIYRANHSQFNTNWGRCDRNVLSCWTIDDSQIMPEQAQRSIALTYIRAFAESVAKQNDAYMPLLTNPAFGAKWLPNTYYVANFADSQQLWLADFEEDADPGTATFSGASIQGQHLSIWQETWAALKWGDLDSHVVKLAWDERVATQPASYKITLPQNGLFFEGSKLVFSVSSANSCSLPQNWPDDEGCDNNNIDAVLDWTIKVTDDKGNQASLPLAFVQPLNPQIKAKSRLTLMINHTPPAEPVLARYQFAMADFLRQNPQLEPQNISSVAFVFDRSKRGAILLDDIAISNGY